jgi:transcriptional regulator with XRE-family HTH domain
MRNVHTADDRAFLERLVAARKRRGMTQQQVAKGLGIPQGRVSRMETGEGRIDIVELRHFATLYRRKVEYFV